MTLAPGARFGPYEIVAALGAGGMGEVYRATDSRLKRQVAIKILPPVLANEADRLARFQREAEVLAALNHPHIASIYGIETVNGANALVMELVEGEDLAERIARDSISVDDALPIARQIAEALEAAHEAGVIHRDLKPANIKVRVDGMVKVLDFGLAKLADTNEPARGSQTAIPTITSPAMMTNAGVILGTAAYMSPEQARGSVADKRADIWAFGAVVFEMLTGERAFAGDTISDTLASVLKSEPAWQTLPADVPLRLRRLLRACLAKDPKRRLRDIGDARLQIEDLIANPSEDADARPIVKPHSPWPRLAAWTLAGAFVATIVAVSIIAPQLHRASPAPVARFSAELGVPDVTLTTRPVVDAIGLTRDGSMLVFVGLKGPDAVPLLYVRRLSEALATPLTGTDGADCPFFSPDGQWIGFFADGKLKKIGVRGGAAITLASAPLGRGGDWTDDGSIYFVPNRTGGVMRVLSSGGAAPERVTTLMQGEITQRWPQLLPDGKALLFTSNTAAATQTDASIVVQQLGASERKVIQKGYHGRYLPSGHLVYLHEGTLFAVAFDPARLQVTGPSVPLLEGVASNAGTGAAWFAASHAGLFAYVEGPNVTGEGIPMVWMDRQGKSLSLRDTRVPWLNLAISPVGDRVAFERLDDIWIYDWARDSAERVTSDPAADSNPTWTPDGSRIAFASTRGNAPASNIYWQRVHEAGGAQRLTTSPNEQHPGSWDPTGKFLAFEELNAGSNADIMILPMAGSEETGWHAGTPTVLVNGPSDERQPQFSPDGRWIAYVSNESGQYEVYVRSVRGTDRWPVSVSGGQSPIWSRTRPELYYEAGAIGSGGRIMVVGYTTEGGGFHPRKAELLMDERHETRGPNRMFDVHPDGNRFALAPFEQNNTRRTHVTFLLNYFDELRRLAPAGSP